MSAVAEVQELPKKDVQSVIQAIADKYRCDPNDPLFSILEKMDEYHSEVREGFRGTLLRDLERLEILIDTFQAKSKELAAMSEKLSASGNVFERNAQVVGESTENLKWYWKYAQWYQAISGMVVTLILCGGAFGIYYAKSADRMLSQASVTLKLDKGLNGKRLTLSGRKLAGSGRTEHDLIGEFSE